MRAVILTGGGSRRMGVDKAWLDIGGRPCLQRVWETCLAVAGEVEFQGRLSGLEERFPGVPVWPDADPGGGPLAALAAALDRGGALLLVAGDLPFLTPELLRATAAALGGGADWAAPSHQGRLHPLCAAYAPAVGPVAAALLASGRRDMQALLRYPDLRGAPLPPAPEWGDPERLLMNVNTPQDLERARLLAGPA